MKKLDISKLNEQQKEAVRHKNGPLLILAGAGSGKTATIVHRVAYLISEYNILPYNILAVTFTNKAAQEMKSRVENLIGEQAKDVTISTFHSFCARLLRKEIHRTNLYSSKYSIFDDKDSKDLMKEVFKDLEIDPKTFSPNSFIAWISKLKNELINYEEAEEIMEWLLNPMIAPPELSPYVDLEKGVKIIRGIPQMLWGMLYKIYKHYQTKLERNNALDFDDLLFVAVKLLSEDEQLLAKIQNQYKYVMIDEYQDTNHAQYMLSKLLVAAHKNIAVVGDDYQSIYSFRSADIRNILNFEKDYPNAKIIKLEQNYRSTDNILQMANKVISFNSNQKKKKLWTAKGEGDKIEYRVCYDTDDEAEYIAQNIMELQSKYNLSDFAVLYRVNAQSRAIEDALIKYGLSYKITGGFSFYERKEIKDISSYLKVIHNPNNNMDLLRIINAPKRGIGKATVKKAMNYANKNNTTLWKALEEGKEYLKGGTLKKVSDFINLMNRFKEEAEQYQVGEMAEIVLEDTGYRKELVEQNTEESIDRLENLQEFLNIAWSYQMDEEDSSLEGFIERISLVQNDIEDGEQNENRINLMTIHASKGLEFPVVFVIGLEENMLPYYRATEEDIDGIEEERRLTYVAITRAEEKLFLTRAISRRIYGRVEYNEPSRFLIELELEKEVRAVRPW